MAERNKTTGATGDAMKIKTMPDKADRMAKNTWIQTRHSRRVDPIVVCDGDMDRYPIAYASMILHMRYLRSADGPGTLESFTQLPITPIR